MKRAALSIDLSALLSAELAAGKALPTEFRMFGPGLNKTMKGEFAYSERSMRECAMFQAARDIPMLVIDYEHASLGAKWANSPREAGKAAGWFRVECRPDGLFATDVEWTDEGAEDLRGKRFRYFSPVIDFDEETREITAVINCALTNNPATFGLKPLAASLAVDDETTPTETPPMKTLLASLSLAAQATEAEALSALETLKRDREVLLTATGKASVSEALGVVAAWKQGSEQASVLGAKLAEIEAKAKAAELTALIDGAVKDGKVAPAQKAWLSAMGEKDIETLRGFLSAAPKILPTAAAEPSTGTSTVVLTDADKQVAALFGVKPEDVAKAKATVAKAS